MDDLPPGREDDWEFDLVGARKSGSALRDIGMAAAILNPPARAKTLRFDVRTELGRGARTRERPMRSARDRGPGQHHTGRPGCGRAAALAAVLTL